MKVKVQKGTEVLIVGDVHEHEQQVDDLLSQIEPSENLLLGFVGDIYHKGPGNPESIIRKIKDRPDTFMIPGNHELKELSKAKKKKEYSEELYWVRNLPLSITFEFYNRTLLTMVHGGVLPSHTWHDLEHNVETAFIRTVDKDGKMVKLLKKVVDGKMTMVPAKPGKVWHELYNGRFGYIVSGHDAQKDGLAKFYNFSCNLDSCVYHTGKLTAQYFSENGKGEMITVNGPATYPDLDEMYRLMAEGQI